MGDDFVDFLDDLDNMVARVTGICESKQSFSHDPDDLSTSQSDCGEEKENYEDDDDDDDVVEELIPMKGSIDYSDGERNEGRRINVDDDVDSIDNEQSTSEDGSHSDADDELDHNLEDTYHPTKGEDIYGNVIESAGTNGSLNQKYVPPHLRKVEENNDQKREESLRLIRRALNSSLNRLSEDTIVSVAQSISQLYPAHPTSIVHETIWENMKNACVKPPILMIGLIPVYTACLIGVHIQTGDTVQLGEYLLEAVVSELWKDLAFARSTAAEKKGNDDDPMVEKKTKPVCNLVIILCYLYNYNVVHCSFMYDVVRNLIENFSEVDIECLLLLLSHCGRSLRSDNPLALKEIVLLVQKTKSERKGSQSTSRAEYMVSAIMDLKNNKRRKQDDTYGEKASKMRKILGRIKSTAASSGRGKVSSEASLRITLQDILNAEIKGRWWKVGASWVGNQFRFSDDPKEEKWEDRIQEDKNSEETEVDSKLLRLASQLRMNTDRKRSIFCMIMGGTDCEDAFEKLCRGGMLQNRSERDTVRILMECCGNEKAYNKYYGHLASRICEFQPQCKFSFQLAFWDTFKQFGTVSARKAANLAKLLFQLVAVDRSLRILNVIKTIDMTDDEMDETTKIFLTVLFSSILEHFDDPIQVQGLFASSDHKGRDIGQEEETEGIQASLLVFFLETLKASPKNKRGSKFRNNFKAAVKALDQDAMENMF